MQIFQHEGTDKITAGNNADFLIIQTAIEKHHHHKNVIIVG